MAPSTSTRPSTQSPTFDSIGVRPVINCYGTYTIISGSRALKPVAEAMFEATNHYVHIDELMEKVGQRLAELTGAEWGYVSSGCAAALTELCAACIAGGDPEKMARLPDARGMKNEVIIQKGHRNSYDRAFRLAGAEMIEVVTVADLQAAIGERTALVAFIGDLEDLGQIPAQEMIRIAHEHGLVCIVDAAAQRPDVPNRYLQMGADAVGYSGGKHLRGPQAAGLVLGRKDLLKAAFLNAAPHHGVARPMKAGKEEIMGLLAAVEAWVRGRDHQAEWRMWEGFLETIRKAVASLPSVRTEVRQPGVANVSPCLFITWDERTLHCTPRQVYQELYDGDPRIVLHCQTDGLMINAFMMESGEDVIVAKRLRELLSDRPQPSAAPSAGVPPVSVAGDWEIRTRYVLGQSVHSMSLAQDGDSLSGTYRSQYSSVSVKGKVEGKRVQFTAHLGFEANKVDYAYTGSVEGDAMSGSVTLGEYGAAEWVAHRVR